MTSTTTYRNTPAGIVAVRGDRELHVLATSVEGTNRARRLLAANPFDKLFRAGRSTRATGRNVRYIRIR